MVYRAMQLQIKRDGDDEIWRKRKVLLFEFGVQRKKQHLVVLDKHIQNADSVRPTHRFLISCRFFGMNLSQ